ELENHGADSVVIHKIESPDDFVATPETIPPVTLAYAGKLNLDVVFKPQTLGQKSQEVKNHYVSENCIGLYNFNTEPYTDPGWKDSTSTIRNATFIPDVVEWRETNVSGSVTSVPNTRPGSTTAYALRVAGNGGATGPLVAPQDSVFESNVRYRLSGWFRGSDIDTFAFVTAGNLLAAVSPRTVGEWSYFEVDFWGPFGATNLRLESNRDSSESASVWVEFADLKLETRNVLPIPPNFGGPAYDVEGVDSIPNTDPDHWVSIPNSVGGNCTASFGGEIWFGSNSGRLYSWDGATWTDHGVVMSGEVLAMIVFGGELIIAADNDTKRYNGVTFTDMGQTFGKEFAILGGSLYLARAGFAPDGPVVRWDGGTSWTTVDTEPPNTDTRAIYSTGTALLVPFSTGEIKSYDGSTWTSLGQWGGIFGGAVSVIEFNGVIYIGTTQGALVSNRTV
ncbi:MAG: hypothetical protein QGF59_18890, partial [Pirellulaceae bacterium]|nr:hypothetical protein [Pirellulaceae bacterium]